MARQSLKGWALLGLVTLAGPAWGQAYQIEDIEIEGLERITAGTALSYLPVEVGDTFDDSQTPEVIRELFRTGFFDDVELARRGDVLVVIVSERPAINEIRFSGNNDIPDEALEEALESVGLRSGRVFNRTLLERIENEIREQYFARGRYNVRIDVDIVDLARNRVDVDIDITEGPQAKIRGVNLVGNQAFDDGDLKGDFESGVPRWWQFFSSRDDYSREKLSGDLETLRSHYLDSGFLEFDVDSTQVTLSPNREDLFITINVDEGEPYTLTGTSLAGDFVIPEEELESLIEVDLGAPFSRSQVTESAERMAERLEREGYAFANVNPVPDVDEDNREVTVTFFVDPGPRVYVRRINISGNENTQESVYRRELRQMESSWYNGALIERSRIRLQRLPFVASANVETRRVPGSDDEVDLDISVTERQSGALSIGAGYSQNQGLLLSGSISQDNFLGTGNRFSTEISTSDVNRVFRMDLTNPHYTPAGASRGFSVFYREVDAEAANISRYSTDRYGFNVTYGIPLSEVDRVRIRPGFEHIEVNTVDHTGGRTGTPEEIRDELDEFGDTANLVKLETSYIHDTRDSTTFASEGRRHRIGAELAIPGSDREFYKLTYSGEELFRLSERFSFSLSGGIGYGDGFGSDELPFFERFFAGGIQSVRGYEANRLGDLRPLRNGQAATRDSNDDPYGGRLRTTVSGELFFPAPFAADNDAIRMSTFVDAGNVFNEPGDFDVGELRAAAGLALTWFSPVGPLSFSVAEPLNDEPGDDTQSFQFQLGAGF
ncbi:outer membrane protein assembly factor BamA [Thioalkalivibrio sp. ALR17-21]|uniref:outer membrane protein assembly factor BamA n=1 Tax=Thioalkalivibrio sp. ALR17-21 TaxID=1269813 RepID=UPI0004627B06|nr:outer membrane protein assembly factor BamA [Thioalkalivibrio sp. ALR17-21]